jgi:hypothetical protein
MLLQYYEMTPEFQNEKLKPYGPGDSKTMVS